MVTQTEATTIASRWTMDQMTFPGRVYCRAFPKDRSTGARLVNVAYQVDGSLVAKLRVNDDHSVDVLIDRQAKMRRIATAKFGDSFEPQPDPTETRLGNLQWVQCALAWVQERNPGWFKDPDTPIEVAYHSKADFIIPLRSRQRGRKADLWVKVVNTRVAKATYNNRITDSEREHTITVQMNQHDSDLGLRQELQKRIAHTRRGLKL